jgi:hypothetical protein
VERAKAALGNAVVYVEYPQSVVDNTEAVVIATAWPQYEKLNYTNAIVIDGRRIKKGREAKYIKEYRGLSIKAKSVGRSQSNRDSSKVSRYNSFDISFTIFVVLCG